MRENEIADGDDTDVGEGISGAGQRQSRGRAPVANGGPRPNFFVVQGPSGVLFQCCSPVGLRIAAHPYPSVGVELTQRAFEISTSYRAPPSPDAFLHAETPFSPV